jgi:hypothetical protein
MIKNKSAKNVVNHIKNCAFNKYSKKKENMQYSKATSWLNAINIREIDFFQTSPLCDVSQNNMLLFAFY